MSKTVLITQSNYIPWKGYFDAVSCADEFIIFDEAQYTRRDWRNRNRIVTPEGVRWLTVPVSVKGKYHQSINETRISDPGWAVKHWKTIQGNYARAPHFNDYADVIAKLYLENDDRLLSHINERFISAINTELGIDTVISRCEDYGLVEGRNERLIDLCIKAGASRYLTGPAAKGYLNSDMFHEAGIEVHWLDYSGYPEYPQMFNHFEHGVTILDLMFNTGPDFHKFMKLSAK